MALQIVEPGTKSRPGDMLGGYPGPHSALALQKQRLRTRFRLSPAMAEVVAVLIYGGHRDD